MPDQPVRHRWVDGSKIGIVIWILFVGAEVVAGVQLLKTYPGSGFVNAAVFTVLGITFLSGALLLTSYCVFVENQLVHWQRRSLLDWLRKRPGKVWRIQPTDIRSFRLSKRLGLEQALRLSLSDGSTISITRSNHQPYAKTFDAFLADLRGMASQKEQV